MRILNQAANPYRYPGGKNDPQKYKQIKKFYVLKRAGCSLLKAEGFFSDLDDLHGSLGIGRYIVVSEPKKFNFCSAVSF